MIIKRNWKCVSKIGVFGWLLNVSEMHLTNCWILTSLNEVWTTHLMTNDNKRGRGEGERESDREVMDCNCTILIAFHLHRAEEMWIVCMKRNYEDELKCNEYSLNKNISTMKNIDEIRKSIIFQCPLNVTMNCNWIQYKIMKL